MSDEEKKDLGDKAKEAAQEAADKAKEFAHEAKEEAKEFAEGAKETAKEFTDNLKEATNSGDNKKILAGILAIILGSLGVHKFILGYNKEGIIMAAITIVGIATSCLVIGAFFYWIPGLIGLIEGIIYLTKSDEEFYNTYQVGKKPWF
jgi:TM2 domain-containing membrane protein YozV